LEWERKAGRVGEKQRQAGERKIAKEGRLRMTGCSNTLFARPAQTNRLKTRSSNTPFVLPPPLDTNARFARAGRGEKH